MRIRLRGRQHYCRRPVLLFGCGSDQSRALAGAVLRVARLDEDFVVSVFQDVEELLHNTDVCECFETAEKMGFSL